MRGALEALEAAGCITLGGEEEEGGGLVEPTTSGRCEAVGVDVGVGKREKGEGGKVGEWGVYGVVVGGMLCTFPCGGPSCVQRALASAITVGGGCVTPDGTLFRSELRVVDPNPNQE